VNVKAVAVSDGADWAVVVGADMLIVPENLADAVREAVAAKSGLRGWQILFNATHTHSGPGGWAPGLAAKGFSGDYDPAVLELLTQAFTEAILESYGATEPASVAHGSVDASEYIRNRARAAEVDGGLDYMVIEQQDGDRCYVARFSAHPTLLGDDNFEFSGDFPGFLQRFLEAETGGFAMYLGGALGSMSASPPEAADDYARAEKMGEALGRLILEDAPRATRMAAADVASAGSSIPVPPLQLRLSPSWRLSPFAFRLLGIDDDAWVGGVRIGEVLLMGMPCDFSGELSRELRLWGKEQGYSLWMLSFNGDYVGYVSPDKYYGEYDPEEGFGYEMGLMSWCGPNGGGYFSDLAKRVVENLAPARGSAPVQEAANT
jgi:neutral ceramidase